MADAETVATERPEVDGEDDAYPVTPDRVEAAEKAVDRNDDGDARDLVDGLSPADVADLLESLTPESRKAYVRLLGEALEPEVLAELDEAVREDVLGALAPHDLAAAVQELEADDALEVVADLEEDQLTDLLERLPVDDRMVLEQGLSYERYSAGRLMAREFLAVPAYWNVGDTIDFMRASDDLPDDFYDVFVVDPRHRPVGSIPLSRILRNRRAVRIGDVMDEDVHAVPVSMSQEDVAHVFRQHDLVSTPVVDEDGRIVGVVTVDDIVDVIDEEHEEDIMRLGGVQEEDLYRGTIATTKSRFTWLLVNLGTAVLASLVIAQFEATLEQIVALAVLMPIVASMGGNAGTQSMTVAVRAIATHELTRTNIMRLLSKEVLVGSINGALFAIIAGVMAGIWFQSPVLGSVIAAAMIINLIVAGFFGVAIPFFLERMKVDPAVASAVLLTTVTDVVGFFAFLGLAGWALL